MSTLHLQGVDKSFGPTRVLRALDLEVPEGAVVAVLGRSGSGKTTLLRLIAGTERADGGRIAIGDRPVDDGREFVPPERRRVGYVAQEGALFPHLSVAKNVAFGLRRSERASGRVEELLAMVNLSELAGRFPHELSGGQQQRVALARALAPRPKVVLLDEPFSALDAGLRASLRAEVMQILRSAQITTVLVTHDQEEALSVADLLGVMMAGQIRQLARPDEIYAHPADPEIANFLGEANLFEGRARGGQLETALGELSLLPGCQPGEGEVVALVRPEQIALEPAVAPDASGLLKGRIVHHEYYGHDSVYLVELAGRPEPIRVRRPGAVGFEVGARVAMRAEGETVAWARPGGAE